MRLPSKTGVPPGSHRPVASSGRAATTTQHEDGRVHGDRGKEHGQQDVLRQFHGVMPPDEWVG